MRRLLVVLVAVQVTHGTVGYAASSEDRRPTAQESVQPARPSVSQAPTEGGALPVSIDRIKKGLATEPTLKLEPPIRDDIPRYYVEVLGTPTFETFLQGFDLVNGPVPGAAMTHREFLQQVAPKDLYSQAGFGGLEVLTANLGFAAVMYLAQKAFTAMVNAKNERELQAIREQIRRELAELEKARAGRTGGPVRPPGPDGR